MARRGALVIALLMLGGSLLHGAAGDGELVFNPYQGVDWGRAQELKANLHTHTTQSDGSMAPGRVIGEYQARGYRVLALTDHNKSTWPWAEFGGEAAARQMIPVPGNELSRHHHTLSLFTGYETAATELNAALDGLAAAGGLGVICHPAMHWPELQRSAAEVTAPLTAPLKGLTRGDFTIAAWFRTTDPGRHILVGNFEGDRPGALNLELHTENRVRLFVQPVSGPTTDLNVPAAGQGINTRDGQWHHLAGLRRGKLVQLYLDGRPAGELADVAGAFELHGDRTFVGRDHRTGATALRGDLDEVGIWSRGLSAEEIGALAAGRPVTDGLVAAYAFETSAGQPVAAGPVAKVLDDSAGQHPAAIVAAGAVVYLAEVPTPLAAAGRSRLALRFGTPAKPETVPDGAVAYYRDLFERYPNLVGVEVSNGTRPLGEYPLDRELWDRLLTELMPARPVWGVANDDTHGMTHLGRDWTMMLTPTADEAAVRQALTAGAFTFSTTRLTAAALASPAWTPRLTRIGHDPAAGRLTIEAEAGGEPLPDNAYVWISAGREVARGPVLDLRNTPGLRGYVRAEITGDGGVTFTQPFGLR